MPFSRMESNDTLCYMVVPEAPAERKIGVEHSQTEHLVALQRNDLWFTR